jgi:hypothetical protein
MDSSLCPYKNLFGKPGEGAHKYRILDIAIIDLALTIISAYLISRYYNQDFKIILTILILLGIIMHRLFCVKTTIDKLLFR